MTRKSWRVEYVLSKRLSYPRNTSGQKFPKLSIRVQGWKRLFATAIHTKLSSAKNSLKKAYSKHHIAERERKNWLLLETSYLSRKPTLP
jgi:hypothetical protein